MSDIYVLEEEFPIYSLECSQSFNNLTKSEKEYSFALIKGGWYGGLIDLVQCSPESPGLFLLSQKLFKMETVEEVEHLIKTLNYEDKDSKNFLNYFTMVYDNLGNYRSFGDSKFIPRLAEEKFNNIITSTKAYKNDEQFKYIFNKIKSSIYLITSRTKQLGLGDEGISTYYSYNCTKSDATLIQSYLDENNISAYNTRVFKTVEKNGKTILEIRQASSLKDVKRELIIQNPSNNTVVHLVNGDYHELMALMVKELKLAERLALNETEKQMVHCYIDSFVKGDIEDHKKGSRYWIKDKKPVVENYIGFIESYRDPHGVRGEFEAFVAIVNKEMSEKFEKLVDNAKDILKELPWPEQYEKDVFLQPDFTSLDIINFPNSGLPVGINIPNYDDIRGNEGFKNVSLGNVLKSRFKDPKTNFISSNDKQLFLDNVAESFEIQVGLHELIGHGSGKLFHYKDGNYNFNVNDTKDILTDDSITKWYKDNETWDSVFTNIASPFEECRAESVGLYLCSLPSVTKIFGHHDCQKASDVVYVNWLSMIKSSIVSMEYYTLEQCRWRQAHCQARFVILKVLLEAGEDFINIETVTGVDGKPDIVIHINRDKISSVGKSAMKKFLRHLQYYKSTANVEDGRVFFNKYSILNANDLKLREIVMDRKLPRSAIIQPVISERNGIPVIDEYPSTTHGMINSFIQRFSGTYGELAEKALFEIWDRDWAYFQ